ncbi:MAG: cation:proton antiporter [Actinomycetota bacterium]
MPDWLINPAPHTNVEGPVLTAYVLLGIFLIVVLARVLGTLCARIGQPRVVGEILAGVLLGPTLLGSELSFWITPAEARPTIGAIASFALILFMFLAGVEYDVGVIKGRANQAGILAVLSVAVPALIAFPVALAMHNPTYAGPQGSDFVPFALFIGAALSVTAFPVMAHILMERGELNSRMGSLGVATAGIMSVIMFTFIAFAGAVAAADGFGNLLLKTLLAGLFVVVALIAVRPVLSRVLHRELKDGSVSPIGMGWVFAGVVLFGLVADRVGINALVGGFLFGLMIPQSQAIRQSISAKVRDIAIVFLLPVFFATAGFNTDLKLITWATVPVLVLFLAAAIGAKFIGVLPARSFGLNWNEVGVLGALLNTRGLLVLVAGLIGLQLEIITISTFTIIVVCALVTNFMTLPLLNALSRRKDAPSPGMPIKEPIAEVSSP